jgi:autotransporter adhesin
MVLADGSTALGANAAVAPGATNAVAVGESATVAAPSGTALGQGAVVTADGAVALGRGAVADAANTVSVGNASQQRRITHVAAGGAPTDAANTGQVDQALASARAYTDQRVASMGTDVSSLRRDMDDRFRGINDRVDAVGAMGAAMSQMAFSTQGINSPNRLGVGVGGYHNQGALAVGYSRQLSSHASLTFGAAVSGNETSGGVGLGVGWFL